MVPRSLAAVAFESIGVSFSHGAQHVAVLRNLDLDIARGSFVCLLGRTGCGKSTLLKLVLGELEPTAGRVMVNRVPVTGPGRHCGYVPQKYGLFPDRRVIDNVTFGPLTLAGQRASRFTPAGRQLRRETEQTAYALLDKMGLRKSDGRKFPAELSGGMQQRVAIAQALATGPSLLLMDEAFSALDGATRASMQDLIREMWLERGATVLFVTHNIPEAIALGSRIVVLARDPASDAAAPAAIALDTATPWTNSISVPERRHSREWKDLHAQLEHATRGDKLVLPSQPLAVHGGAF